MNLKYIAKKALRFGSDNSPTLLTAVGVVGVVGTAVLASKATIKANEILKENKWHTRKDAIRLTYRAYVPTALAGAATIACIVCANRVSLKRYAALAAGLAASDRALAEYKAAADKVLPKKEKAKLDKKVAQQRVDAVDTRTVVTADHEILFVDGITGQAFSSTIQKVDGAINQINHEILNADYAGLYLLQEHLGLQVSPYSYEVGWHSGGELLQVAKTAVKTQDDRPAILLDYKTVPTRNRENF